MKKKYVIDVSKPFEGSVFTIMTDGMHDDYTHLTLEQLRNREQCSTFEAISAEELEKLVDEHRVSLQKPFEEISDMIYWDLYINGYPAKIVGNIGFFVGEAYQYDLHEFCFKALGKYYKGLRSIDSSDTKLLIEIKSFLNTKENEN